MKDEGEGWNDRVACCCFVQLARLRFIVVGQAAPEGDPDSTVLHPACCSCLLVLFCCARTLAAAKRVIHIYSIRVFVHTSFIFPVFR